MNMDRMLVGKAETEKRMRLCPQVARDCTEMQMNSVFLR